MNSSNPKPAVMALAANGNYVHTGDRFFLDAVVDGKRKTVRVNAIFQNDKDGICILFGGSHVCIEKHLERDELAQVEKWILDNLAVPEFPEGTEPFRTEMILLNTSYAADHGRLRNEDFAKAERLASLITDARRPGDGSPKPVPGDIVEGAYYGGKYPFNHGLIDSPYAWHEKERLAVCAGPYTPFTIESMERDEGYVLSTSGGPFFNIPESGMELVGPDRNTFCMWGYEGPCRNGTVLFKAAVNRWRIKDCVNY